MTGGASALLSVVVVVVATVLAVAGAVVAVAAVVVAVAAVVVAVAAALFELRLLVLLSGLETSADATFAAAGRSLDSLADTGSLSATAVEVGSDLPRFRGSLAALRSGSSAVAEGCSAFCAGTFSVALEASFVLAAGRGVWVASCSRVARSLRGRRLLLARSSVDG